MIFTCAMNLAILVECLLALTTVGHVPDCMVILCLSHLTTVLAIINMPGHFYSRKNMLRSRQESVLGE